MLHLRCGGMFIIGPVQVHLDRARTVPGTENTASRGTMGLLLCVWYVHSKTFAQFSIVKQTYPGFPSSALCIWGSTLANAALFALLLPSVCQFSSRTAYANRPNFLNFLSRVSIS